MAEKGVNGNPSGHGRGLSAAIGNRRVLQNDTSAQSEPLPPEHQYDKYDGMPSGKHRVFAGAPITTRYST